MKIFNQIWLVFKIMAHLGYNDIDKDTSIDSFRKKYVRADVAPSDGSQSQSWMCLKRKEGACILLDQWGQCSIYDVRPVQCSTYPFWPSLLKNKEVWEEESVLPDNLNIEGTNDRHWSPDLGGCEGIILKKSCLDEEDGGGKCSVASQEIELKKKAAKNHWKRFPVDEIKQTTWFL